MNVCFRGQCGRACPPKRTFRSVDFNFYFFGKWKITCARVGGRRAQKTPPPPKSLPAVKQIGARPERPMSRDIVF